MEYEKGTECLKGKVNLKRCEADFPDTRMKGITLGRQLTPRGRTRSQRATICASATFQSFWHYD